MATWPDPRSVSVGFAFGHSQYEDPSGLTFETVSPADDADAGDDPGPVLDGFAITDGRIGDAPETQATQIDLTMRNDDGEFSPDNVSGSRYGTLRMGTPLQVGIDLGSGPEPLATANALDFLPSSTGPDTDPQVRVPALGLLNRLGRDVDSLSPLRRFYRLTTPQPFAYWPMDGAIDVDSVPSVIGPAFSYTTGIGRVSSGVTDGLPAGATAGVQSIISNLPTSPSGRMSCTLTHSGSGELAFDIWFAAAPTDAAPEGTDSAQLEIDIDNLDNDIDSLFLQINFGPDFTPSGVSLFSGTDDSIDVADVNLLDGRPHHVYASLHNSGSDILGTLSVDGIDTSGDITGTLLPTTPTQLKITMPFNARWTNSTDGTAPKVPLPITFFGLAFYDDKDAVSSYDAGIGYVGEQAHDRIERICTEAAIPYSSSSSDSATLGPQPIGTALAILRDAETTDGGVLYELADGRLSFQSSRDRYNADIALSLSWNDIVGAWPGNRDRDLYNLITVTGPDGVSATAELTDGPLGTDTSEGVGPRPLPVTRNVADTSLLPGYAGWLLHQKTTGKSPYQVIIDLTSEPSLASDVLGCGIGSRIQIADIPAADLGPDDLDLIIEGREISYRGSQLLVRWYCEPYDPWRVFEIGDQVYGRLDTSGSALALDVDSDDTSLLVATDSGKACWITSARTDDFPFAITVGGEVMKVTAISGTTSPQTFTVTRSLNGVEKSHTAGTDVRIAPVAVTA